MGPIDLALELALASEELQILDNEQRDRLISSLKWKWPGRYVRCPDGEVSTMVGDLLVPGFLLTRRLDSLVLVVRDDDGAPAFAVQGCADHLEGLVEEVPQLQFALANARQSWKIVRVRPRHLRIEGAIWTKFFPWMHVGSSAAVGALTSLITFVAMMGEYGEFWLPAGGPGTMLTSRSVGGFWFAVLAPCVVAGLTCFLSLARLGPERPRSPGFWAPLFFVSVAAIVIAVGLAFIHEPVNAAH